MTGQIERRLSELGIALPKAATPVAAYCPVVVTGGLAHVSGQLPFRGGDLVTGRVGDTDGIDTAVEAARLCGLMILAQLNEALGDLDRVERIVRLGVFVNSAPGFHDHPKVANGASELMQQLFGDAGVHARAAVGVAALPLGALVEIDALVAVRAD